MSNQQSIPLSAFFWLLQHSNDLIITLSSQAKIIHISSSMSRLYGLDPRGIHGIDYFEEVERLKIEPPITRAILDQIASNEHRVTQKIRSAVDTEEHIIEWLLTCVEVRETENHIYIFLGRDVTQQRQAERRIKSTMLNLENIVSCMPGNIYWMDKNLMYLGCNTNTAEFIGLKSPTEVIGKSYEDCSKIGGWEEDSKKYKKDDLEVLLTGLPKLNVEEPPLKHPDGRIVDYLTSRMPVRDEYNNVIGIVGISIDITERKKMELALLQAKEEAEQANNEKLGLLEQLNKEVIGESAKKHETIEAYAYAIRHYLLNIIEHMPGNVYWMDKNLIYLGCNQNAAKLIGLSPTEIIGKTYDDFSRIGSWEKGLAESFKRDDLEVLATGRPKFNIEEPPIKAPNGEMIHFLTSRVPLRDEQGNITGIVAISVDITELKKTQAELKAAEARIEGMTALSASIAHELRTPLSAIQMGIDGVKKYFPDLVEGYQLAKTNRLLRNKPIYNSDIKILYNMFDTMKSEVQYSNTIINMILMNVKQKGLSTSNFESLSMNACVDEALQRYPFKRKERDCVRWRKEADFFFQGDKTLMVHVLFNLIRNALYYIEVEKKGKIEIWIEHIGNNHVLYFKDTAKGVPLDVLPQLFEKFYTTTRHGTGLGLAYCKTVMNSFGGIIRCQSEYGRFTQFEMIFPQS